MIVLSNVVEQPEIRTSSMVIVVVKHYKKLVEIGTNIFKIMVKHYVMDLKVETYEIISN